MMAELPDRATGEPRATTTDATAPAPPPAPSSDTPPRDPAPTGDAGHAPAPSAATADAATAPHGVSERDAALLLDMKEPAAAAAIPATTPAPAVRSILNAASDSSDGEDAAAVAARDNRGRGGDATTALQRPHATKDNQEEEEEREEHEEEEEEDVLPPVHGEKGVEYTLSELFVNPNLKLKSANVVLKKDPFAIPRATDNVTEYRPRFNPLSILMSEEKLLPRNFTFDFSEEIPGEPKHQGGKMLGKRGKELQGRASRSNSDFDAPSLLVRKSAPPPVRNPQVFGDKLSTMGLLMGSMPRQPQASPKPLINTPTVHNPFGEPLLELVVNNDTPAAPSDAIAMQRLRAATVPSAHSAAHLYPEDPQQAAFLPPPSSSSLLVQAPLQETLGAEFDAFGVDMHNISNLSKLSIAANNVASADSSASFQGAAYATVATSAPPPLTPPTPVLYDTLANYLPNHFAEKRVPNLIMDPSLYDVAAFHGEPSDDHYQHQQQLNGHSGYEESYGAAPMAPSSTPAHSGYNAPLQLHQQHHQQHADSLQPVAKKPRSKNVFRPCTHPGCTKGARGKSGLCQKHGGGKRCATPNCPKGAQGSSKYCLFHGGGYRCTVPGCTTGARGTSGLCAKHGGYKRAREGGTGSGNDEAEDEMRGDGGPADKRPRMETYEGRALEASG